MRCCTDAAPPSHAQSALQFVEYVPRICSAEGVALVLAQRCQHPLVRIRAIQSKRVLARQRAIDGLGVLAPSASDLRL